MPALFENAAHFGVAMLLNSLWQGALIAGATWAALRLFPRANASTRYAAWSLALAALVIVPIATSLTRISVEQTQPAGSYTAARTQPTSTRATTPRTQNVPTFRPNATAETPAPWQLRFALPSIAAAIAFGAWLLVALVVLARLIVALWQLERLKNDALPLSVDRRDAMPRWQAVSKGERDVRVCVSDEIEVPVAIGLFDSMVLLPAHLVESLDPAELDQISLHELAHLLRADDWTNGLQRLCLALLFFNPAAWFIARQMDVEREVACDDFVLELTGAVRPYAFCLTKMAEMTAWPHAPLPAPGVFVTRKNISIRIERLLRSGRAIGRSITPSVASAVVVALVAVIAVLRTVTPSIAFTLPTPPQPVVSVVPPAVPHGVQHVAVAVPTPASVSIATSATSKPVDINVPAIHVNVPAVHMNVPAEHVTVPGAHISLSIPAIPHVSQRVAVNGHDDLYDCEGCNFSGANLAGHDFSNHRMTGANFSHANLRGARFDHASLDGTNFEGADLRKASFVNASLQGCNMEGAGLEGIRFDGAHMEGCNIDVAQLAPAQARYVFSACEGCNFERINLEGMDLHGIHLEGANLERANLRNANLSGVVFSGVNLSRAILTGARLDGAVFEGCNFDRVDLRGIDLSKATITGSSLQNAIMR